METLKKEEDNSHTGNVFLQDSALPKKQSEWNLGRGYFLVSVRITGDTVLNVIRGIIDAKYKTVESAENNSAV